LLLLGTCVRKVPRSTARGGVRVADRAVKVIQNGERDAQLVQRTTKAAFIGAALTVLLTSRVITPTISVRVRNDTPSSVQLSTCGSDPVTLRPRQVGTVDPNPNDPKAACVVTLSSDTTTYVGCLLIPTTAPASDSTALVSAAVKTIPEGECGD